MRHTTQIAKVMADVAARIASRACKPRQR